MNAISGFFGKNRILSNFHLKAVEFEQLLYPSTENAYQAAKSLDLQVRYRFTLLTPSQARKAGQEIDLRPDWESVKDSVMYSVNAHKFQDGLELKALMESGDSYLEESNWWHDTYWGVCYGFLNDKSCKYNPHTPVGQNKLGEILMRIRKEHA